MARSELELFRQMFADNKVHMTIGIIQSVTVASDRSAVYVQCQLAFEERQMVARMSWDCLDDEAGCIQLPSVNDAVILGLPDAEDDHAVVLARLTSREERIPIKALDGSLVVQAKAGAKLFLASPLKISIAKKDNEGTEPLVLGNVAKSMMNDVLAHIMNQPNNYQIGFCAVGPVYLDPEIIQNLTQDILKYLTTTSTNILSQIAYTERGN